MQFKLTEAYYVQDNEIIVNCKYFICLHKICNE